ncbi:hypothetical protein D3C86_1252010 [compost metagenome]
MHERALAGARRADDGHRLARLDLEADPFEAAALGAGVAEADVLEDDLAAQRHERARLGAVGDLERGVEDLGHPHGRGARAGDHDHREAQRHDGMHEKGQVVVEGEQLPDREAALDGLQAAEPDDREGGEVGHQHDEREVVGDRADGSEAQVQEALVGGSVARKGVRLTAVGPHDPQPPEALLELGVEGAELVLDAPEQRADPPHEVGHQPEDGREGQEGHERQLPVEEE